MRVVWLTGTIASGKTSVGRALARLLRAHFLDGDDLAGPAGLPAPQRWRIAIDRLLHAARRRRRLVIAYPIQRRDRARLRALAPHSLVIALATPLTLVLRGRGRSLSPAERRRIRQMRSQAYHRPPFADATLTNTRGPARHTARLIAGIVAAAESCPTASGQASRTTG